MSSRSESTFEPSPRYRPVVALEIDGVLDLPVSGPQAPEHLVEIELTVKRDLFPSSTRHQPEWMDGEWRARHWISKIGLSWIQSLLAAQIEVVWASTWREYANVYFTDSIGLPHLPVATRLDGGRHENLSKWKASGLAERFDGRPLLWLTDELTEERAWVLESLRHPSERVLTRLQYIPDSAGISRGDVEAMNEWLRLVQSPEGHDLLRLIRRQTQDRARQRGARRHPSKFD